MNGPTICLCADGSARRTSKPPRSRARGTITCSTASQEWRSPGTGSLSVSQLIIYLRCQELDCSRTGEKTRSFSAVRPPAGLALAEPRQPIALHPVVQPIADRIGNDAAEETERPPRLR